MGTIKKSQVKGREPRVLDLKIRALSVSPLSRIFFSSLLCLLFPFFLSYSTLIQVRAEWQIHKVLFLYIPERHVGVLRHETRTGMSTRPLHTTCTCCRSRP